MELHRHPYFSEKGSKISDKKIESSLSFWVW